MDIAVTGSSGLIGTALLAALRQGGHRGIPVVRPESQAAGESLRWDPNAGTIDAAGLEGLDAVVHLAGTGIGDKRWTPERKQQIVESRVRPTTLLAETLAGLAHPPGVLVSGSAVGWYGNRGSEVLTETSGPPNPLDFAADVCRQWEAATTPAEAAGIRTVHIRTGVVLAPEGGVLPRMALPFKLGLGGRIGSGKQYLSWIGLADELGAILHAITTPELSGPLNATAPTPVTNGEFTAALGHVLKRPDAAPDAHPRAEAGLRLRAGGPPARRGPAGGPRPAPGHRVRVHPTHPRGRAAGEPALSRATRARPSAPHPIALPCGLRRAPPLFRDTDGDEAMRALREVPMPPCPASGPRRVTIASRGSVGDATVARGGA